jgi:hypothetical protein
MLVLVLVIVLVLAVVPAPHAMRPTRCCTVMLTVAGARGVAL